jgi:hypothetical protein
VPLLLLAAPAFGASGAALAADIETVSLRASQDA